MKYRVHPNAVLWLLGALTVVLLAYASVWWHGQGIIVSNENNVHEIDSACTQPVRRPFAVMLAGDVQARPLSGISSADIVVEIPVTPNGITRMMAVFSCSNPEEIGSIRSARSEFLPFAGWLDVILAHWGGEFEALERLRSGILDNIDGLVYDGTVFVRKPGIRPPHNGFSSTELLLEKARGLEYDMTPREPTFSYTSVRDIERQARSLGSLAHTVSIPYPAPYDVVWIYDSSTRTYMRSRNSTLERDALNEEVVSASSIVVLETTAEPFRDQYLAVDVLGSGKAEVYQNGTRISGTWSKDPSELAAPLILRDTQGDDIRFIQGTTWIHIILSNE